MMNIFEVFLPQLLRYPNPNDPLNGEAAALMMRHPKEYESKVKGASCLSHLVFPFMSVIQSMCRDLPPRKQPTQLMVKRTRMKTR